MIDTRIETFLTLCKVMNYRKTAELLNMTQPAVTQHIHFLEDQYGCKLFNKKQAASGLSKTDFLVKLLKGSKVTAYHFTDDVKCLCNELRKIGVNLNQIAYLVNIGRHTEADEEILRMRTAYFNIFDKVSSFLDKPSVNGQWLKSIKFKLPIIEENISICLDNGNHVECVVKLTK